MKNKSLLFLGTAVVTLSLYAYFGEYKREINEEKAKAKKSQIVYLKKDQIQKIEFKKGDGAVLIIERTVNGWDVTSPIRDQADNEVIDSFLDEITGEKSVDEIDLAGKDLAEFGMSPSMGVVTLVDKSNRRQEVEISTRKNFEGLVFLRRDKEEKLLTSTQTWTTFLTKPVDQFRNLRLYRGSVSESISKVEQIRLENAKGRMEFKYQDGIWVAPAKKNWKIDQNAIRKMLTDASGTKGVGLISDPQSVSSAREPLLLLEFSSGQSVWKGVLRQDTKSKDVIGTLFPSRMTIRFPPQALEDLRSKTLADFRDKSEPFIFQKSLVKKIIAKTKLKSFSLIKVDNIWKLEETGQDFSVNSTLAEELLFKLGRLTVYRFVDQSKVSASTAALNSEIQLLDHENKLIFKFSWSDFKDHEGYAQTNLFREIFQIDDAQVSQMKLHEIVKSKLEVPTQQGKTD